MYSYGEFVLGLIGAVPPFAEHAEVIKYGSCQTYLPLPDVEWKILLPMIIPSRS
jgi:hypothetical protein